MEAVDRASTLVLVQDRQWAGDPRRGAMTASVDATRVGIVLAPGSFSVGPFPFRRPRRWSTLPVQEELSVDVAPGRHVIRVRHWWYRSPGLDLVLDPGQRLQFSAGIDRSAGPLRTMVRLLCTPWKALRLVPRD